MNFPSHIIGSGWGKKEKAKIFMLTGSPDVTEYCVLLPRTLQREPLAVGVTEWCALDCEPGILKGFKWLWSFLWFCCDCIV